MPKRVCTRVYSCDLPIGCGVVDVDKLRRQLVPERPQVAAIGQQVEGIIEQQRREDNDRVDVHGDSPGLGVAALSIPVERISEKAVP